MDRSAMDAVFNKKLVFTITAGRTGTAHLARMLAALPDSTALDEPDPAFSALTRAVAHNPEVARRFLLKLKLPFIAAAAGSIYAETAHGFGKGFLVPMLQMGLRPGLIFLRRAPREVALAHYGKRLVPGRTPSGNATLFHPADHNVLALPGWETLSDYQLCYWYALAVEQRQRRYAEFAATLQLPYFDATAAELNAFPHFAALLRAFGIDYGPELRRAHARIAGARPAPKPVKRFPPADLDRQEEMVWARIRASEPDLRAHIDARYAPPAGDKVVRFRAA